MTEHLIIRIAMHEAAAGERARIADGRASDHGRGRAAKRSPMRTAIVAVAAGVLAIVAGYTLIDFSSGESAQESTQDGVRVAKSQTQTNDRGPLEPAEGLSTNVATKVTADVANDVAEEKAAAVVTAAGDAKRVTTEQNEPDKRQTADARSTEPTPSPTPSSSAGSPRLHELVVATTPELAPEPTVVAPKATPKSKSKVADARVVRAQLSSGIQGNEPTGGLKLPVRVAGNKSRTVYYFSEVKDLNGQTVFHRWEREGSVLASIPFKVRGKRWRVYSNKKVTAHLAGNWRVVLADSKGKVLASTDFLVR
jgi:hypothetical protein